MFPLQQWLRERAAMLCYTYVAYLVFVMFERLCLNQIIHFCALRFVLFCFPVTFIFLLLCFFFILHVLFILVSFVFIPL
jgi:hypothetical protein